MTYPVAIKSVAACALFIWTGSVFGHEINGLGSMHWHATDTLGLLLVVVLAAVAAVVGMRGK